MSQLAFLALGLFFMVVTVVYTVRAIRTTWQAGRNWRSIVDDTYTQLDKELAWKLGFFLLTPIGVLAHELAHLVTAQALGARHTSLSFYLYWGAVSYAPHLGPSSDFTVAAAGPAASVVLGLAALGFALRLGPPWQHILQSFGMATLSLALVIYPAMSYGLGFGDYTVVYGTSFGLSVVAGCAHAAALGAFLIAGGRLASRDRIAHWAAEAETRAGQVCFFKDEDAARLHKLERSWTRFLPGTRQELAELRELRDWIVEHNRQVQATQHTLEHAEWLERAQALSPSPTQVAGGR